MRGMGARYVPGPAAGHACVRVSRMTDDAATTPDSTGDTPAGSSPTSSAVTPPHEPPAGAETLMVWEPDDTEPIEAKVVAGWTVLRAKDERPAAEVFHVSYTDTRRLPERPVTFVFNGGPGAASAYLHVGIVGPRRVFFPADGSLPAMPPKLIDNEASWLAFSDLVFIDPVGTGYSRIIPTSEPEKSSDDDYFSFDKDVAALGEVITRWLSANKRWGAPVFIAGESYGGYRVARMARTLQEQDGVALSGAILISPALEFAPLNQTGYDVSSWVDRIPTMVAAALHHGRCRAAGTPATILTDAVTFAGGEYASFLTRGAAIPTDERASVLHRLAAFIGLGEDVVTRVDGRVTNSVFVRELLRDEGVAAGLYDATITTRDPFPEREPYAGPDPTLSGIGPAFTTAINQLLSSEIGLVSDRRYQLLSMDVNLAWKIDKDQHATETAPGGTNDLRYGLALNPHLQVHVCHGRHDLITPWYASRRLLDLMRLDDATRDRVTFDVFDGGHMFYTWADSRAAFTSSIEDFMRW